MVERRLLAAGLLALLGDVTQAHAADVAVTLAEAVRIAQERNPELLGAREQAGGEAARAESAARLTWPRFTLQSAWSRSDNPAAVFSGRLNAGEFRQADFALERLNDPAALSHLTSSAALELPLDVFGRVRSQARGRRAAARASSALAEEVALELSLRVSEAYRSAGVARRALDVTERALQASCEGEAGIEARVTEGAALTADLLRARSRRRQREADVAERRADLELALARLARLLAAEGDVRYVPSEDAPPQAPLAEDEAAWVGRALAARPAVEAARAALEAARWSALGERRALLPEVSAFAQLQDDRNALGRGARSGSFGALVRWNFDPAHGKRQAGAEADRRAAEHQARAAADQVRLEVATAWRLARLARERHAAASGGAEEGREALRVMRERRREGIATLTDELETEAASLAAELEEVRAAAKVAAADSALERAAGVAATTASRTGMELKE